ncbi:MAG: xanthine dehydrogenase accessory protein XdhC [Alphaproteobacteria bacterium]|nr:xanthine dehydrogenase accessory protein XdhC [Alphaproteobacteria bacterium]
MSGAFGVLISILETKGSAPREAGTVMWVDARGIQGTIGGGNLEFQAIEQARKLLADDSLMETTQTYALGPLLEQCCGGSVVLHLHKKPIAERTALMVDHRRLTPLYMFGAGHVGRAVMAAIHKLPFAVTWFDERAQEFPTFVPRCAQKVAEGSPIALVEKAPPGSLFLIFTHSHQLDYAITAAVLARGDARFCGLIGSKTKRARFENRMLKERVISEADLPNLTCPIGVEGITGKEPEVIAAAVAAQLLQQL